MNRGLVALGLGLLLLAGLLAAVLVPGWRSAVVQSLPPAWSIQLTAWRHGIRVDHDVAITMPDGVRLTASLYLPRDTTGPLATVLVRLPYHRLHYSEGRSAAIYFARQGYAAMVQDLRGSGDSGGELLPWKAAASDGEATLNWIARQRWSNGKVGTFGCSALGETQFLLAARNHPAHAAMIPSGAGGAVGKAAGRYGYFGLFEGGVFQLASGFGWFAEWGAKQPSALPAATFSHAEVLKELPVSGLVRSVRPAPSGYSDFLAAPLGDPLWESWGYLSQAEHSRVPALVINTWGDQTLGDTLALAEDWRLRSDAAPQKVVIGPGQHCNHEEAGIVTDRFGELPIANAARPWRELYLRWFDHWLRGQPDTFADLKAYTYFMLVDNQWHSADRWPPAEARTERWFLDSGGHANSRKGDGTLAPQSPAVTAVDAFRYDPDQPVPSRGGPLCCTGNPNDLPGPADQAEVESRDDVLVYTSAPLDRDLRIVGPLKARLTVSSDALDTDLVLRLAHVAMDGRSLGMQEGALRLRYRDGYRQPARMEPGRHYEVTVDLRAIAYLIPKGHRLRLQITSSSFPRLERNLNTGNPNNADETRMVVATNRVHHGPNALSYLELPVLYPAR